MRTDDFTSPNVQPENQVRVSSTNPFSHEENFGVFRSSAWSNVLERTYGFTPVYFTAVDGDRLLALLSVMEVKSWLTGIRGVSLPFTDHYEPFASSKESLQSVFESAKQHGRKQQWKYLEVRGGAEWFGGVVPSLSFFGHTIKLNSDPDAAFSTFDSAVRRSIRKAEKSALSIEISQSLDSIRAYYHLHCRTRKRHGLPPQPFKFFLNIHRQILSQNLGMVISARQNDRMIASAMFFHSGSEALYKFGASDPRFQDLRPNNLVMWEAIKWCARHGKKLLDLGRTSVSNEGLRRYKLGWGAEERSIRYFKFDFREDAFVTDKDSASGWHNRVFRMLPVFCSRLIGRAIYRHVA